MKEVLKIHPGDNLLVALLDQKEGKTITDESLSITLKSDIPAKHKFAIQDLKPGEQVIMYGVIVGKALKPISAGELITTENIIHDAQTTYQKNKTPTWTPPNIENWQGIKFEGYHRSNGQVGTANYWVVVPLVFCENRNLRLIKSIMTESLGYRTEKDHAVDMNHLISLYQSGADVEELLETDISLSHERAKFKRVFPNVDGIKFLEHAGGCGSVMEDSQTLCELLAGYITHSNVAGATVLSLGCQQTQVDMLNEAIRARDPDFNKPMYVLEQQNSENERDFIEKAVKYTFIGLAKANTCIREEAGLDKIILGLECGGSDGFSGLSANPALGSASDLLVALGGTTVLSEFPELHGVEQELVNRCTSDENASKFIRIMERYHNRAKMVGSGFYANPSPGNIKDGLITDAMKSAGAAKKGGTSPITDVLDYTEAVKTPGLNLLCTPGNDVESTTGLVGSGANVVVFTTGLGTPTGNPIAPVVKIATNTALSEKMGDIIDMNMGDIISGERSIDQKGADLLSFIVDVASGRKTTHADRLGQDDFLPWKRGISL